MKKAKGGWEEPTVFAPLSNWNGCLCKHNLWEQKLWVRNVGRSLMKGGSAFGAVSLNRDYLIFCLCSSQNEKKARMSDLQLLIVCLLLMSCTFWRGLWLLCGKGIYWLISCVQMHNPPFSYKHLYSWCEHKSSLDYIQFKCWDFFLHHFIASATFLKQNLGKLWTRSNVQNLGRLQMCLFLLPHTLKQLCAFPK